MPLRVHRRRSCAGLLGNILPLALGSLLLLGATGRMRPSLFRIELQPTTSAPGAQGIARLAPAPSPFGLAVTPDGHFIFDVELIASGLPAPASVGPYTQYIAWVVTADLATAARLGVVSAGRPITGQVTYSKFLVVISAEGTTVGDKWKGPVMLRGFSPSALLENFSGKTMFNGGMPQ